MSEVANKNSLIFFGDQEQFKLKLLRRISSQFDLSLHTIDNLQELNNLIINDDDLCFISTCKFAEAENSNLSNNKKLVWHGDTGESPQDHLIKLQNNFINLGHDLLAENINIYSYTVYKMINHEFKDCLDHVFNWSAATLSPQNTVHQFEDFLKQLNHFSIQCGVIQRQLVLTRSIHFLISYIKYHAIIKKFSARADATKFGISIELEIDQHQDKFTLWQNLKSLPFDYNIIQCLGDRKIHLSLLHYQLSSQLERIPVLIYFDLASFLTNSLIDENKKAG